MSLNATKRDQAKQAAEDLAKKLRLETEAARKLRKLFSRMAADMRLLYIETGNRISSTAYAEELTAILAESNNKTAIAFSSTLVFYIMSLLDGDDEEALADITRIADAGGQSAEEFSAAFNADVDKRTTDNAVLQAINDSAIITATNQREIDSAFNQVIAGAAATGLGFSREKIAVEASGVFRDRSRPRAEMIATTTVQKISESSKFIESRELETAIDSAGILASDTELMPGHIWVTIGDSRVREAHVAADFTHRENGYFSVGGELLRYPGDPDGSAGNIINCRCSAVTSVE